MHDFLKIVGGILLVSGTVFYFLLCAFAPIGIVWLILNH